MKVNLKIEPATIKSGFFSSTSVFNLVTDVTYTPEEEAAIDAAKLDNYHLLEVPPIDRKRAETNLLVFPHANGAWLHGPNAYLSRYKARSMKVFAFRDQLGAQRAMDELKSALVKLKSAIEATSAPAMESFEL